MTTVHRRAPYKGLAALGLLLVALAPAVLLATGLAAGLSIAEEAPMFLLGIGIPLVAAVLTWRFGVWAQIVGILAALAAAAMLFWMAFGLAYPASPADFVPGMLLPLGVLLAVAAGIAAIRARRRPAEGRATRAERVVGISVLGAVAAAVVVSGAFMLVTRSAAGVQGETSVVMHDFAFDQEAYTVPAGEATALVVRNSDPFTHTFTVPELGIHEIVAPGTEAEVEITAEAGTYTLYCEPHSNMEEPEPSRAGMAASLVAE